MNQYKNLILILFALLLVGGGLAIWSANKSAPPETVQTTQTPSSQVTGKNVSFIVTEGEVKKWKLEASQAIYNEDQTEAHLTDVHGEFYDKTGKPVLQFTAPKGEYTNKNNDVVLSGGVVAKSITGKDGKPASGGPGQAGEMHAPQMTWNAKSQQVTARGGVQLSFPQGHSSASVCRFNLDFSDVQLEGGVSTQVSTP